MSAWQVKKLRMVVEDEGTRGDGDMIPGAFKKVLHVKSSTVATVWHVLYHSYHSAC
jgi:hypothetical protein